MRRNSLFMLFMLFVLLCSCRPTSEPNPPSETVVDEVGAGEILAGRVLGHDGTPMPAAHLTLSRSNFRDLIFDDELAQDGSFRVELPGPGVYSLRLAGVNHAETNVAFAVEAGAVELHARLGTYARAPEAERLLVRMRWLDGDGNPSDAHEVEVLGTKPHLYTLPLDPPANARAVQYQLVDPSGRSFNGPGGTRWVYDGGGDFWAERTLDGAETLELDLTSLPPSGAAPKIDLQGEQIVRSRQREGQAVIDPHSRRLREEVFGAEIEANAVCEGVRTIAQDARAAIIAVADVDVREAAAIEWAWFFGQFATETGEGCLASADLLWVFELVPPEQPAWAFVGIQIGTVFMLRSDDAQLQDYRRQLAAKQRDPGLLAQLVYLDILDANRRGDAVAVGELYSELSEKFAGSVSALWASERFDPNRPLQVGRLMPDWQFAGLDGEPVSSAKLHGRPYLLMVWATWCGPCVDEMEALHTTHETLGGERGPIAFVSVSIDDGLAAVEAFRRDQWPMPWINAHVPSTEHGALYDAWGFRGVPLHVLVGGDGTILGMHDSLRGEALLPTLRDVATASDATPRSE